MALVLFEPFIIRRLKEMGYVHTVRSAKKMIERQTAEVWDILEEVTKGHPVLLNRAPTLHRLSIQAFEPQLIEGEAIRIHPLVCTAYNADFDGDQMAVHVPLSIEAQMEARMLMLAPNNIFSPSSGKPITTPSQDITLGCYYITQTPRQAPGVPIPERLPLFNDATDVDFAINEKSIKTHDRIRFRNPDLGQKTIFGDPDKKVLETTAGRVRFNQIWPKGMGFFNNVAAKKQLSDIILKTYQLSGQAGTVETLDKLKDLGFTEATKAGISIGIFDMIIPTEKKVELERAYKQIAEVEKQRRRGIITDGERYNKIIDIWTHAGDEISNVLFSTLKHNEGRKEVNPVFMAVDSGARGNRQQLKQLAGMRGLMAKPSGEIIEQPITSNFREGLSVLEYFISTHGARKGLADTALKTADSGYLTHKLVDASQNVIITDDDCGTVNGIVVKSIYEGDEEVVDLSTRIAGRVSCETVVDPVDKKTIIKTGDLIEEVAGRRGGQAGRRTTQNPLGADLRKSARRVRAVLRAQPGDGQDGQARRGGRHHRRAEHRRAGHAVDHAYVPRRRHGQPDVQAADHQGEERRHREVPRHAHRAVAGRQLHRADQERRGEHPGQGRPRVGALQHDHRQRHLVRRGQHDQEGRHLRAVGPVQRADSHREGGPRGVPRHDPRRDHEARDGRGDRRHGHGGHRAQGRPASADCPLRRQERRHRELFHPGGRPRHRGRRQERAWRVRLLAKTPRKIAKTKDITGGLPRVAELFEARRPKDACEIAKLDGIVEIGGSVRGKRKLLVKDPVTGAEEEHLIPLSKHIIVFKGDFVKKGSQLTEGSVVPHDLLDICGPQELQEHLGQRGAGGLPPPGRGDQRQAHRDHRPPDAAQGEDHRAGRHLAPLGRSGGPPRLRRREQARSANRAANRPRACRCCWA